MRHQRVAAAGDLLHIHALTPLYTLKIEYAYYTTV
jgi:hypothetical protein